MTARSFCYASAGIFLLVAAYTLGARHARADFDPNQPLIVGTDNGGGVIVVLRSDGTEWHGSVGAAWAEYNLSLPIPVNQVAFWNINWVVAKDGRVWNFGGGNTWIQLDPLPTPPVGVEGKTWSGVKQGYREGKR